MATSTVALGKLEQAVLNNQTEIPQGWALDSEGRATCDVQAALAGFLMPLGGYKGSGLGLMVEILGGVLGGGGMAPDIAGIREHGRVARVNHTFLAIDVARFLSIEEFHARMEWLLQHIKSARPPPGSRKCWWPANRNGAWRTSAAPRAFPSFPEPGGRSKPPPAASESDRM